MAAIVKDQLEYVIGGLSVKFPYKPYGPQIAMMSKIIKALTNSENALLESPTGSGKSLALLCSALAWQKKEMKKIMEVDAQEQTEAAVQLKDCSCKCHVKIEPISSCTEPVIPSSAAPGHGTNASPILISDNQTTLPETVNTATSLSKSDVSSSKPSQMQLPSMLLPGAGNSSVLAMNEESLRTSAVNVVSVIPQTSASCSGSSDVVVLKGGEEEVRELQLKEGMDKNEDEDVFKPSKKRFRQPVKAKVWVGPSSKKVKQLSKGIVYEDDVKEGGGDEPELIPHTNGQAKWRMEFNTPGGVVPGIGIPQSQIMDTGVIGGESSSMSSFISKPATISPTVSKCHQCDCQTISAKTVPDKVLRYKYPKIYYATRTHKQIAQISRELRKTAYADTPMCILASREHTCVHPSVSKSFNKNDECRQLLDYNHGVSCSFFHRVQQKLGSQAQIRQLGLTEAWDIEDLVQMGKKVKACPYFASRGLMEEADIIFCPYNYIVDPLIREQMLIDIANKVIILDEAHNMEDCARESASLTINSNELMEVVDEIEGILPLCGTRVSAYQHLSALIKAILRWMNVIAETLPTRGYEQAYGIWTGQDFIPILDKEFGITEITLQAYKKNLRDATEATLDKHGDRFDQEKQRMQSEPFLGIATLNRIKSLLIVMSYIFKENGKHLMDYRISLMKTTALLPNTHRRRGRKKSFDKVWIHSLNFWCLNPAVAFLDLIQSRSIILTSGTLSPLASFASELGVSFPIQLETSHVIPDTQTWIKSISCGPNGVLLNATYQNSETYEFKDELGELVLGICETVPYGVLCFFSSYSMLEKLTTRWEETGAWGRISSHKLIVTEPRSGGKEVFEEAMTTFYQMIYQAEQSMGWCRGVTQTTGALFLAVCRGKVSEGLDFSDNHARAVITIGIPFPNIKNKQIELKREYNNEHCQKRGLLTGSEWYEIQAYRALNQALGRCLRHKRDWGALILVDARYSKGNHYIKGLSKWVRHRVQHESNFKQSMASLRVFTEHMMRSDTETNMKDSKSISILERSSSSSTSVVSSMTSPRPAHSTTSHNLTAKPPFLIDSPGAAIPEQFQVSSPELTVTEGNPITSTPVTSTSSSFFNPPPYMGSQTPPPQVIADVDREYPKLIPIVDVLKLEQSTAPDHTSDHTSCTIIYDTDHMNEDTNDQTLLPPLIDLTSPVNITSSESTEPLLIPNTPPRSCPLPETPSRSHPLPDTPPRSLVPSESPLMFNLSSFGEKNQLPVQPVQPVQPEVCLMKLNVDMTLEIEKERKDVIDRDAPTPPIQSPQRELKTSVPLGEEADFVVRMESCVSQKNDVASEIELVICSPLGQPKTRRANLRMATRMSSRSTSKSNQKLDCSTSEALNCLCGEVLLASMESVEKITLEKMFSSYKQADIRSSNLRKCLLSGCRKKRNVELLLVSASELHYSWRKGLDEHYNCVWEERLGICYSLIHCQAKCKQQVGAIIHATKPPTSNELIGKAVISILAF